MVERYVFYMMKFYMFVFALINDDSPKVSKFIGFFLVLIVAQEA